MGAAGKSCLLCRQISFANLFTHRLMLTKHSYEAQHHLSRDSDTHCGPAQIMIKTTLSAPIPTGQSDPGQSSIKVVFSDDSRLCRIENRNEQDTTLILLLTYSLPVHLKIKSLIIWKDMCCY